MLDAVLPSLAEVEGLRAELLRELVELTLDPVALAVIVRLVRLGVVERLVTDGSATPEALATELRAAASERGEPWDEPAAVGLEMVLELARGLGLLAIHDGLVHATELSRTFLARGSSLRLLGHVEHYASYLPSAASILPALARTRRSRRSMWTGTQDRDAHARYFAARQPYNESRRAYFWDSSFLLLRAHRRRDLAGHRRACDVGSGPAGFAALLAKCHPGLEVHAVEASLADESYRRRTVEALRAEGVEVALWGLDALHDPLPGGFDLVTFNRLLSGVPRDGVDAWIDRACTMLAPGGVLAAVDYVITGDPGHDRFVARVVAQWMGKDHHLLRTSPPTEPHDDKHQWGWTRPWHAHELCDALRRRGLRDVGFVAGDPPFTLVFGTRP
jgi:SAM-dependent methyltransferase